MRVLALDYGSARCGCALSDPTGTIVTPIETVERPASKRGLARLRALVRERDVQRVIVGLPLTLDGGESAQTGEARAFARALSRQLGEDVPVELHDERFTTRMAQRLPLPPPGTHRHPPSMTTRRWMRGRRGAEGAATRASEDSRAAAHLLESWLAANVG